MKNKLLVLSLVATVFYSCSNDDASAESTPATNSIETSNVETLTDETSKIVSVIGPTIVRRADPGKDIFEINIKGGSSKLTYFINGKFIGKGTAIRNQALRRLTSFDLRFIDPPATLSFSVQQEGTDKPMGFTTFFYIP